MTITTPQPIDRPDWYIASSYATALYYTSGVSTTVVDLGYFYVADAPAFGFVAKITGGEPWSLYVSASNGPTSAIVAVGAAHYQGMTDCTVHDNLPTSSAWVDVELVGGTVLDPLTIELWWWQSQTPDPGGTLCLDQGLAINETTANVVAGTTSTFESSLLIPGIHNWCFDCDEDLTGIANLAGWLGTSLTGRMVRIFDPLAFVGFQGQAIVSTIQPVWQVVNSGGTDVQVNATLTKGF